MKKTKFNSVLLIDDNAISNVLHQTVIDNCHFSENTIVFESAENALQYLQNETSQDRLPEIIFLDINMPVMNGFGFLSAYNKLPAATTQKSKIIMLTSSLDDIDMEKAKADSHVIDFFVKPLTIAMLNTIAI